MIPIVFQRVQRIAADVFSVPIAQISAESSADTIETWDSLATSEFCARSGTGVRCAVHTR